MNQSRGDVDAFLKVLDPQDNQTGGGTASAVAGAMAAGLAGLVARVSVGKEGMETDEYYRAIDEAAVRLSRELMSGARKDSEAFGAVMSAFRMPRGSEEEKALRSEAIQRAMVEASRVPLANAERCGQVLSLVGRLQGRSNENAASDLDCARGLARTGLEGCLANVDINLPGIKDGDVRAEIAARAAGLRAAAGVGDAVPAGESDG